MAGSVNKVILVGNLGRDPELRKTAGGAPVTDFAIATTDKYTDKSGQRQEQTEWHNIVCWNRLAEIASQYLKKGSSVFIEGKLRTRSWEDNGHKKYKTEIVATSLQLLDKPTGGGGFGQQQGGFGAQNQGFQNQGAQNQGYSSNQGGYAQNRTAGFGGDTSFGEPPTDNFGGFDDFGGGFQDHGFSGGSAPMPNTSAPRYSQPQQPAQGGYSAPISAPSLPVEDELPF